MANSPARAWIANLVTVRSLCLEMRRLLRTIREYSDNSTQICSAEPGFRAIFVTISAPRHRRQGFAEGPGRRRGASIAAIPSYIAGIPRTAFHAPKAACPSDRRLSLASICALAPYQPPRLGPRVDDPDTPVETITETKVKPQRPPMYKVLFLNDDYTPMEFVVHVLERVFAKNHDQAIEIMLTVHRRGLAVVGVYAHEIAETKVAQVTQMARARQHPLQCTMEKE